MSQLVFSDHSLERIKQAEGLLFERGVQERDWHLLTHENGAAEKMKLHPYNFIQRHDIVHGIAQGAVFGVLLLLLIFTAISYSTWVSTIPFFMLVIMACFIIGFCCWEGGLLGLNRVNYRLKPYLSRLDQGEHLLLVDVDEANQGLVKKVCNAQAHLTLVDVR